MNVRELIEALKRCPQQDAKVSAWNNEDNNEFDLHVVAYSPLHRGVVLQNDASEIAWREIVLHDDNPKPLED